MLVVKGSLKFQGNPDVNALFVQRFKSFFGISQKKPESFIRLHPPIATDIVPAGTQSRCHDLLGLLNPTKPLLMLLEHLFQLSKSLLWKKGAFSLTPPSCTDFNLRRGLSLSNKRWNTDLQTFTSAKDNQTDWLTHHVWVWKAFKVVCALKLLLATAFFFFESRINRLITAHLKQTPLIGRRVSNLLILTRAGTLKRWASTRNKIPLD